MSETEHPVQEVQNVQQNQVALWKPVPPETGDLLPALVQLPKEGLVGRQNIEPEALTLPFLSILQGTSQQVQNGLEGAQPGKLYLSLTDEVLKPPLRALVIYHYTNKAMFINNPNDARYSGLKTCVSRNGVQGSVYGLCDECRRCVDWGPNNEPPLGNVFHNFVLMTGAGLCVLRLGWTNKYQIKYLKQFLSTWSGGFNNIYDFAVNLRAHKHENKDGKPFYAVELAWDRKNPTPPEIGAVAFKKFREVEALFNSGKLSMEGDTPEANKPDDFGEVPF